jgi:hypothetical protein
MMYLVVKGMIDYVHQPSLEGIDSFYGDRCLENGLLI